MHGDRARVERDISKRPRSESYSGRFRKKERKKRVIDNENKELSIYSHFIRDYTYEPGIYPHRGAEIKTMQSPPAILLTEHQLLLSILKKASIAVSN